jgi:Protein of unknown function (DUF3887)
MATNSRTVPALIALTLAFLVAVVVQAAGSQDAEKTLTSRAIAFVRTMAKGDFETAEADFTDQMKQAAPPEKLRQIWQSLLDHAGPFENTGDSKTVDQGGYTSVIITTKFKTRALGIAVTFDSAQRIAGMHFVPPP